MLFVPLITARERYAICKSCDEFNAMFKTCNQCGCIMPAKVTVSYAACPVGKWPRFDGASTKTTDYRIED
jgi:hypothetical protein